MQRDSEQRLKRHRGRRLVFPNLPLHWMLIIPFALQALIVAGLLGYLSYRNGQNAVASLTNQLMESVMQQIQQELTSYLSTPRLANQLNSDAVARGDLSLDISQPDLHRDKYLWETMTLFENLTWITLGTETGESTGVWRPRPGEPLQINFANRATQNLGTYYATNQQGQRTYQTKVERPAYDPRTRPWYKEAIAARQAIWTQIYAGFTPGTIFIAASQPLYDSTGKLVGVSGTDISLLNVQQFLAEHPVSVNGKAFLIERSGLLVASSDQEPPFRLVGDEPQRVQVTQSQTPLIRATGEFLSQQFGRFTAIQQPQRLSFQRGRQTEFVQVLPFAQKPGLNWLIVTVVPESDVMAEVDAGTRTTVWLCAAALLGSILLNGAISRWLVKPIIALSRASQQIAQGDFSQQVEAPKIQELSTLAHSFSQMSQEIQQSRQRLEDYSRSLEQQVSDRTQALQQEIQQRRAAEAALQSANRELQQLAYLDGLTQIANRRQFDQQLTLEWQRMLRSQMPLSLILCDVDYFKQYNDTYGHQDGDDCLRAVAEQVSRATRRPADLAARYGGEEFAVLLPCTDLSGALEVARAIQLYIRDLQRPHRQSQASTCVTVSLGVASLIPTANSSPEQLLAAGDRALYQAKLAGRDRISKTED